MVFESHASGDSVVIYKLDRISRSTKHLIELSELFEELSVNFISIQDNVDTSTSMGRFFFRVMASLAELERDIINWKLYTYFVSKWVNREYRQLFTKNSYQLI
ncbi:hypothetical protein EfmJHP38_26770 [Enterococcus faecium]|nr:hypothetical protein EfmJHP38_26770 [Enterococcus faecium]